MGIMAARYSIRAMAGGILLMAIGTTTSDRLTAGVPDGCADNWDPFTCLTTRPEGGLIAYDQQVCIEDGYIVGESSECATCLDADDEECSFNILTKQDHKHFGGGGQN